MAARSLAAVLGALAAVAAGGATASAAVIDCSAYADYPNTQISSARGMSCGAAVKVMRSYRGDITRRFTVKAFRCTRQSGGSFGGQWRCVDGSRAFRFEFKD